MNLRRTFAQAIFLLSTGSLLAAPTISSIDPLLGSVSNQVNIFGSGFFPGTLTVKFNNATDFTAIATSLSQITGHVPTNATTGPIIVTVNGLSATSSVPFIVIGKGPYVTNFFPISGPATTSITVQGVNFLSVTNVGFTGTNVPFVPPSYIQFQILAPPTGESGPLVLTSSNGVFSTSSNIFTSATNFFYPPRLTGFSPTNGRTDTVVIIRGTNFLGTSSVLLNGASIPTDHFLVLSNRALQVTIPTNSATGKFQITTPAGMVTTTSNFVVPPTIYSFSPTSGSSNTPIVVFGANLNAATPAPSLFFHTNVAAIVSGFSFYYITSSVPANALTGPLTVNTTNGSFTSTQIFYVSPSITDVYPSNAPPGNWIRISGNNLTNASAVTFTGAEAIDFVVTNNSTLGVKVPSGVKTGPLIVTTPGGTATSAPRLFYAAPLITSFSPTNGVFGTPVTILGTNLSGTLKVLFNGQSATVTNVDNGRVNTAVPNGATTGKIRVITPAGTNDSVSNFKVDYVIDLIVDVVDSPDPVLVGSNLTYSVHTFNNASVGAPDVIVTNDLPPSVTLLSASVSQGSVNTNSAPRIIASLGTLAGGNDSVVTLVVIPNVVGMITNIAMVGGDLTDPNTNSNFEVTSTRVWPYPKLAIQPLPASKVRLTWPAALSNVNLQYTPNVAAPNLWSNLGVIPYIVDNQSVVTQSVLVATNRFYRLKN